MQVPPTDEKLIRVTAWVPRKRNNKRSIVYMPDFLFLGEIVELSDFRQ